MTKPSACCGARPRRVDRQRRAVLRVVGLIDTLDRRGPSTGCSTPCAIGSPCCGRRGRSRSGGCWSCRSRICWWPSKRSGWPALLLPRPRRRLSRARHRAAAASDPGGAGDAQTATAMISAEVVRRSAPRSGRRRAAMFAWDGGRGKRAVLRSASPGRRPARRSPASPRCWRSRRCSSRPSGSCRRDHGRFGAPALDQLLPVLRGLGPRPGGDAPPSWSCCWPTRRRPWWSGGVARCRHRLPPASAMCSASSSGAGSPDMRETTARLAPAARGWGRPSKALCCDWWRTDALDGKWPMSIADRGLLAEVRAKSHRAARQGPARPDRLAAEGRQDDAAAEHRELDHGESPRGVPDRAADRRAAEKSPR